MGKHHDVQARRIGVATSAAANRKPTVVVSAVNLTEMGGLSVLTDCLHELAQRADDYSIVALVHEKELVGVPNIHYYEFPRSKRSILDRLYHEYWVFWQLSRRLNPFLWLSLHNTTPNVHAQRRAVYCQNVSNFYDLHWREALLQPRFAVVNAFLDLMYRVNLRRNDVVVVQQEWVRQAFRNRFGVDNVAVAHPVFSTAVAAHEPKERQAAPFIFFYPSHPSIHKNFEIVCDAARQLVGSGTTDFEIWLTFAASDNRYARQISKRCGELPQVRLLGRLSREEVCRRYDLTDCLLFSSKLETWGLPISEFRPYGRPMLVADAAYAREAVGSHPCVAFFPADSAAELARLMKDAMLGAKAFATSNEPKVEPPFARSWAELFDILLDAGPIPYAQPGAALVGKSLVQDATKSV
jgi:glycosyltransferase involved in cell wall biosynthesis